MWTDFRWISFLKVLLAEFCAHGNETSGAVIKPVVSLAKMTVFWDVAPCSLVQIDRRFRGAYCLLHQGDKLSETGYRN
jgi:hypothetical protein